MADGELSLEGFDTIAETNSLEQTQQAAPVQQEPVGELDLGGFDDTSPIDDIAYDSGFRDKSFAPPSIRDSWDEHGKIGWLEYGQRFQNDFELLPYVGVGALYEDGAILWKANKLMNDEYGPGESKQREADYKEVKDFAVKMEELEHRGLDMGGMLWAGGSQSATFAVEFLTSLGTYPLAKTIAKEGVEEGTGQVIKKSLRSALTAYAKRAPGTLLRETKRTARFMGHRVALNFGDRMLNEQLAITDKGDLLLREYTENPVMGVYKSFGGILIENLTETVGGGLIDNAVGAIGRRMPKGFVDDFIKGIPEGKYKDLLGTGWKSMTKAQKELAFDGILQEYGEERLGDLLKVYTGVSDGDASLFDKTYDALFPDGQQVMVELGLFTVYGGTSAVSQKLVKKWEAKGMDQSEIDVRLQTSSETEKEFLLEKEFALEEQRDALGHS